MKFPDEVLQAIAARMTESSWEILEILSAKESMAVLNLMELTELKQAKFFAELARLDGPVLIDQQRDPKDNRRVLVSINSNGLALLKLKP